MATKVSAKKVIYAATRSHSYDLPERLFGRTKHGRYRKDKTLTKQARNFLKNETRKEVATAE